MTRVTIDLEALQHNLCEVNRWMREQRASWSVVTKVLSGHEPTLKALSALGVRSMADSRLDNLKTIGRSAPDVERWYLRLPTPSHVADVIEHADVSINSEITTIERLDAEAVRRNKRHRVIIMIELGDLREGILPGSLVKFYERVFRMERIEVLGIGSNLGCLAGALPNVDQLMQLVLYSELLELKFRRRLPLISAGTTASLPLVLDGQMPSRINHFRIGEALFLGSDLINGGLLPGLRNDVVTLEAEILEIKRKNLVPLVETGVDTPFTPTNGCGRDEPTPGQRGLRALVGVGQLDTEVAGLRPLDPEFQIAGASSDITVVNLGEHDHGLRVGNSIGFSLDYAALSRLMGGRYVQIDVRPPLQSFQPVHDVQATAVPAVIPAAEAKSDQRTKELKII
ncbi:MAG: alanine racemase [Candidatus Alcyoniella australis]|nr:alanine racemase [Candidatus Alcyoniella australis]